MTSNNKGTVQMSKVELELAPKTLLFHADGRPMTSNNNGTVQMSKLELELAHKTLLFHDDGRPYTNKEKELAVAKAKYNLERKKR